MAQMQQPPIPVYIIAGFLEAGKTNFINPMLTGEDFTKDEHTLLIVTEEGEEEYDEAALWEHGVRMVTVEEEDFTTETLKKLDAKYQPTQVVIEHNGMWQIVESQEKFPQHWQLYQVVTIIESTTFNSYAKNMASLMMEKLRLADLIVFNRCTDELAPMLRQRNVKLLNRRAEIYLEFNEERMEEYDDGSVCPFDLSQPVLELSDSDFGFWYTDCMDKPDRYEGKTVRFRGMVAQSPRFPRGSFAVGRFAMVCCAEDTAFMGLLCYGGDQKRLKNKDWVEVTGKVHIKNLRVLGGEGPTIDVESVNLAQAPADTMVYF
jgi:uncharacterized repeat protein (TIGR03943 family)